MTRHRNFPNSENASFEENSDFLSPLAYHERWLYSPPMLASDLDRLIAQATTTRSPILLEDAKRTLGVIYDESDLGDETLIVFAGKDIALTPTAWVRMLKKAKASLAS